MHKWGPRTGISTLFRRRTEPEVSFVCDIDLDYDTGHSELKNSSTS